MTSVANTIVLRATLISGTGSALSLLEVPWVIYNSSGQVFLVSIYFTSAQIFTIALLPWFSDLVDRHDRRKVAMAVQIGGFAIQATAAITWLCIGSPALLAIIASLALGARSFEQVVRLSLAHANAGGQTYLELNRRFEIVRQIVTFTSGLVGAAIFNTGGIFLVLGIDCAGYLAAAVLIAQLPATSPMASTGLTIQGSCEARSKSNRWQDAARLLRRHRENIIVVLASIVPTSSAVAMSTLQPMHFSNFLQSSPIAYYLHDTSYAFGAIALTVLWRKSNIHVSTTLLIAAALAIACASTAAIASVANLAVTCICIALFGSISAFVRIARSNLIMQTFAANEQGRANGLVELSSTVLTAGLIIVSGAIADHAGLQPAWFVFFGIDAMALLSLLKPVSSRGDKSAG